MHSGGSLWALARACLVLATIAVPAGVTLAETPADQLREVERALAQEGDRAAALEAEAAALGVELDRLKAASVAAAQATRDVEATAAALEDKLDEMFASEAQKLATLAGRRAEVGRLLGAAERMAVRPSIALIALPNGAADTVRAAILLRDLTPALAREAGRLRAELTTLAALRTDIALERERLAALAQAQEEESAKLRDVIAEKAALERKTQGETRAAAERMAKLAQESRSLRDLLDRLSAPERRVAETARRDSAIVARLEAGRGQIVPLALPVRGRVSQRFGQNGAANGEAAREAQGLTIEARPGAAVIATEPGRVVFAGPFRGYGQLLIIEHADAYHALMSGMARIDTAVGQRVLKGEPVGVMDEQPNAKPTLYLELRRHGKPVNPAPWLASSTAKVSG